MWKSICDLNCSVSLKKERENNGYLELSDKYSPAISKQAQYLYFPLIMNIKMAFWSQISFVNLKVDLCNTGLPEDSYPGTWLGIPIVEHTLLDIFDWNSVFTFSLILNV